MKNKTKDDAFERVDTMRAGMLVAPTCEYLEELRRQLYRVLEVVETEIAVTADELTGRKAGAA